MTLGKVGSLYFLLVSAVELGAVRLPSEGASGLELDILSPGEGSVRDSTRLRGLVRVVAGNDSLSDAVNSEPDSFEVNGRGWEL